MSDTVATTDNFALPLTLPTNLSDTLTLSDSFALLTVSLIPSLSENAAAIDRYAASSPFLGLSDAPVVSDVYTVPTVFPELWSDNLSVIDNYAFAIAPLGLAETVAASDAFAASPIGNIFPEALADTIAATDTYGILLNVSASLSDTAAASDVYSSVEIAVAPTLSDALALVDGFNSTAYASPVLSDTLLVSDDPYTETLSLVTVSLPEVLLPFDSYTGLQPGQYIGYVFENLSLADSFSLDSINTPQLAYSDTVSAVDLLTPSVDFVYLLADVLNASELYQYIGLNLNLSDNLSPTDNYAEGVVTIPLSLADTLPLTDSYADITTGPKVGFWSDSLSPTDSFAIITAPMVASLNDLATGTATFFETEVAVLDAWSDTPSLIDSFPIIANTLEALNDSIVPADRYSAIVAGTAALVDTISVSDTYASAFQGDILLSYSDNLSPIDLYGYLAPLSGSLSDTLAVSDALTPASVVFSESLDDGLTATDVFFTAVTTIVGFADALAPNDIVEFVSTLQAAILARTPRPRGSAQSTLIPQSFVAVAGLLARPQTAAQARFALLSHVQRVIVPEDVRTVVIPPLQNRTG